MSFLTFSELYGSVQRLSPNQISADTAKADVNEAYRDILALRQWLGLNESDTFSTLPDNSTGTISLIQGSPMVVGVGTTFTSADVGRYLEVNQRASIRVAAFTDATHITLAQAWGEPDRPDTPFLIKSLRYVLPSGAARVVRIVGPNWPLVRRSASLLDLYDPKRIWRGEAMIYIEIEIGASGQREIELWPVPNQADTYSRQCRKTVTDLVNPTDVPVVDGEAIRAKARGNRAEIMYARTSDASWNVLADRYAGQAKELIDAMMREDRKMRGALPGLLDNEDSPGGAWTRAWSALGLGDLTGTLGGYGTGGWGVATP